MNADDRFDAHMRATHTAALERLSPKTQAQLVQRRRRAFAAQDAPIARPVRRWAVATLAVCAIAFGVFRPLRDPAPPTPSLASNTTSAAPAETLDDNPDFYLWLDSSDATSFASE